MRGRAAFIAIASVVLAAAQAGGSAAVPRSAARARPGSDPGATNLPTGCTHGGARFVTNGPRGRKRIAIGFDDGPSDYTTSVLRVLRRFDSHATFFEIGQETSGRAEIMKRVLAQGNEIGNHSLHHEIDPSSESLRETNRLIRNATGFRPCDFRPPDGRVNSRLISRAHAEHMVTVDWDVDPRDWADPGVAAIASKVIHGARNGSIVVMHDGGGNRSETVAALPAILSHFRHRGYQFVTVAELLGHQFVYPASP
ncbi:MAG TPA: polysaccharide deacetylase family protein [Solirubrobacterales bacterium]|jgi:peptidoglycan-N-acetylglucosamine deacetylase